MLHASGRLVLIFFHSLRASGIIWIRWDDEADRVADEPTNEEVLEEVAVVQEPPSGLLSAVAGLDSMVEDLHRAAPGGAREVNWA